MVHIMLYQKQVCIPYNLYFEAFSTNVLEQIQKNCLTIIMLAWDVFELLINEFMLSILVSLLSTDNFSTEKLFFFGYI